MIKGEAPKMLKNKENMNWLAKEVLNFQEALLFLGVSTSMLYKLTHQRIISFYKPNGKLIYFKKADLINWMLSNKQSSCDEVKQNLYSNLELSKP